MATLVRTGVFEMAVLSIVVMVEMSVYSSAEDAST